MAMTLDYTESKRAAFVRGFLKGLAAPVMLVSSHAAPALPQVIQIVPPQRPHGDAGALASDWVQIGGDMQAVVSRHGIKTKAPDTK